MIRTQITKTFSWGVAVSTLVAGQAFAAEQNRVVEEIVVTASKRQESINDVPMSISALSGSGLEQKGVVSPEDLQKVVPGFRFNKSYTGTPVYFIRGVGFNEASLGAVPNVSVYIDEAPLPFSVMTVGALLDLERVEVLKGPQGTLFGQNSTGGAINYVAAKPTNEFSAGATAGYGSFEEARLNGYVSGPLTQELRGRLAFDLNNRGDWQESATSNRELGPRELYNGRVLLDWMPSDNLAVTFNLSRWRDDSDLQAGQWSGFSYLNEPASANIPQQFRDQIENYTRAGDDSRAADWGPDSPHQGNDMTHAALRIEYSLGEDLLLTYLFSHADYDMNRFADGDGMAFNNIQYTTNGDISSATNELRLSGSMQETAQWMIGVNYENSAVDQFDYLSFDEVSNAYALGPANKFLSAVNESNQDFTNRGVFAAIDYDFSADLGGHFSVRRTESEVDFDGCSRDGGDGTLAAAYNNGFYGGAPVMVAGGCTTLDSVSLLPVLIHRSLEEDNTSWRLGLDWSVNDDSLLYANVSKGYKGGSFPNLSASVGTQYEPVTQESLTAYEIGFKSSFSEFSTQLSGAVFYYDYKDKQVRGRVDTGVPFGALESLVNVPQSQLHGIEAQISVNPTLDWTVIINGTYVDSEIKGDFTNYDDFGNLRNFDGEEFPNTPALSGNIDSEYEVFLASEKSVFFGGNFSYQGDTYNGFGENENLKIDAYWTLDLRAGLKAEDGKWKVMVWARNVTDEYYWINQTRVADTIVRLAGQPRSVGVSFSWQFD